MKIFLEPGSSAVCAKAAAARDFCIKLQKCERVAFMCMNVFSSLILLNAVNYEAKRLAAVPRFILFFC